MMIDKKALRKQMRARYRKIREKVLVFTKTYITQIAIVLFFVILGTILYINTVVAAKQENKALVAENEELKTEIDELNADLDLMVENLELEKERNPVNKNMAMAPEKMVALTFDDGPGNYTAQLLDELKERGLKATFFVLGSQAEQYPDLIRRMVAEGHEVANHSYDHKTFTNMTKEEVQADIQKTVDIIAEITDGYNINLMRPPGGAHDSNVQDVCRENGWKIIMWEVDSLDWKSRDVNAIMEETFEKGSKSIRDGAIALFHDIHETTIEATYGVLDRLEQEGYSLVTVSELLYWRADGGIAGEIYSIVE